MLWDNGQPLMPLEHLPGVDGDHGQLQAPARFHHKVNRHPLLNRGTNQYHLCYSHYLLCNKGHGCPTGLYAIINIFIVVGRWWKETSVPVLREPSSRGFSRLQKQGKKETGPFSTTVPFGTLFPLFFCRTHLRSFIQQWGNLGSLCNPLYAKV